MMLLALASTLAAPFVSVSYDQFAGLSVAVNGLPIVQGSAFQYYEPGWKGGIYSSRWQPKTVSESAGRTVVRYQDRNGEVLGTITYSLAGQDLVAHYDFGWNGNREVRIENCFGLLWASALSDARANSNELRRSRFGDVPFPEESALERAIAVDTSSISFDAPFGAVKIESATRFTVFDGRNYPQDWARGRPVHWTGALEHAIKPGGRVNYEVRWRFDGRPEPAALTERVAGLASKLDAAETPAEPLPIVPRPKSMKFTAGQTVAGRFTVEGLSEPLKSQFERRANRLVASRWRQVGQETLVVAAQTSPALPTSGFELEVAAGSVTVRAKDAEGFLNAASRLGQLVKTDGSKLVLPHVEIEDSPKVSWRGVHMFVGPKALEFQTDMVDRLLAPLLFNKVVLQCERTNWNAAPGIQTAMTMEKEDLKRLFETYRNKGIEPIPLIQSLGHMEWFFANGQNLALAVNPAVPYTLDSRKAEAREAIAAIWREAIDLLGPATVHFGLDEISMRGMGNDPFLPTRLWAAQVPSLMELARHYGVTPMVWSDMMLAAGEANDAMHAPDVATAKERRRALTKGTYVADWHYANDKNPSSYKSLALWKSKGMRPIASGWYRPNNVFGLAQAAAKEGAGYLQTTWAGYVSSAENMSRELPQLAAYVLAAEYAWGHQTLAPEKLPYDPADVARRMLFLGPQPVTSQDGLSLLSNDGPEYSIGQYRFRGERLFSLRSALSSRDFSSPTGMVLTVNKQASKVVIAADCFAWMNVGDEVARVTIVAANGAIQERKLVYGIDLRSGDDPNPTATARVRGTSAIVVPLGDSPVQIKSIEFQRLDPAAGLRVRGITLL